MDQITKRIVYLYTLRKNRRKEILNQYNLTEIEYTFLSELEYIKRIGLKEAFEIVNYTKEQATSIIRSLENKGFIIIKNECIFLSESYLEIQSEIKVKIKKTENYFEEKISPKEMTRFVNILDEIIDYWDEQWDKWYYKFHIKIIYAII